MESYQIQDLLQMLIVTGGTLTGLWIIARTVILRKSNPAGGDTARLQESVETLQEHVRRLQDDVVDLTERLDFTERVLARLGEGGKAERRELPGGAP
jgi:hypothetical protein